MMETKDSFFRLDIFDSLAYLLNAFYGQDCLYNLVYNFPYGFGFLMEDDNHPMLLCWYGENSLDINNPIMQLCIQGTQAEFQGRPADAARLYRQAWKLASNDFERCIAAHYVARFQETPQERLRWNQEALNRANVVDQDLVKDFYPSLYLNMGQSFEQLGKLDEAKRYYDLAASLGAWHQA